MIELTNDELVFTFPEVHPDAALTLDFQRTLRIPDDEETYPLPSGLGAFPLRHVDDFAETVPAQSDNEPGPSTPKVVRPHPFRVIGRNALARPVPMRTFTDLSAP